MQQSLKGFAWTLALLWIVLCIAATLYSQQKDIPAWVALAVVPAFLIETGLYISAGFEGVRARWKQLPPWQIAAVAALTACVPYVIYSIGTGVFELRSAAILAALASLSLFWFVIVPPRALSDLGFLAIMALPILTGVFKTVYADPIPRLQLHVLGVMMWYRVGIVAVLLVRRMDGIGFGFIPLRREWGIGIRNYLLFLPLGYAAAVALDFVKPVPTPLGLQTAALAIVTFVITLWVLALAEEFFFRGLIQQILTRKLKTVTLGIAVTSALFGAAHLGYREFPNWRFALLATAAGVFYGRAYAQAGSIRAAMVTHALVVTTWRVFLA